MDFFLRLEMCLPAPLRIFREEPWGSKPVERIISLCAAAAFALCVGCANASLITFSFSNVDGNVAGTVTGTLSGVADEGTSSPTGIVITSAPAGVGFATFPVNILGLGWDNALNSVTITSGVVTNVEILMAGGTGINAPHFLLNNFGLNSLNNIDGQRGVLNIDGFSAITFAITPGTVPEPATLALLGLGLAGLGFARRKTY